MENINCILEGAESNEPHIIKYSGIISVPPLNASVLRIGRKRLFLYGNAENFPEDIVLERKKMSRPNSRGFEMRNLSYVASMPRSIVVNDGRIYINEFILREESSSYLECVQIIMKDCADFFSGRVSEEELSQLSRRAF